jgi:hypothetical protein
MADRFAATEQVLWLAGLWLATSPLVIRNSATVKDLPHYPEILD